MRPGRVNLVDGNCSRTFSLFGDYILRRTRSPVAERASSLSLSLHLLLSLSLAPCAYPSSEGPLSSRTPRLMSAPLGTFNSEERVQISTTIRLARQLPPGSPHFLSPGLSLAHLSVSLLLLPLASLYATSTHRTFASNISSRHESSRGCLSRG